MKYFFTRIIVSVVFSLIFFFVATTLANNIDMDSIVSKGSISAIFTSGSALLSLVGLVFGYVLFCVGYIFSGLWGLIRHIGIWSILAFIAVLVILPLSIFITYNSTMETIHKKFDASLNTVLDKEYGSKIKTSSLEKLDSLSKTDLQKLEKESGMNKSEIEKKIKNGEYSELLKKIPQDSGLDLSKEMQKRGIDPNSPLVKMLLGSQ